MARCLYCGKSLWLRLPSRGSEFCGEEHRRQYDELVLARLQADEADPAGPAEETTPPAEPEAVTETGAGEAEMQDEWAPAMSGFRQTGPVVALPQKTRPRQPIGFHWGGIASRPRRELRHRARPAAARLVLVPVSPSAGRLQAPPAVEWKIPRIALAEPPGVQAGCSPRLAKLHKPDLWIKSGAAGKSPGLAGGQWTWGSVLPNHTGLILTPVVWETPHPAQLIRLGAVSPSLIPARLHSSAWRHSSLAIPARRFAAAAAMLPAPPRSVTLSPRDNRARTPGSNIRVASSPIALPRLKAHPTGIPVLRREEMNFLVEPGPQAVRWRPIAWVRGRWSAAPRFARVAVLGLPLLGATATLAPRIPEALHSLHWQHPALARQIESRLQQRAVIEVVEDFRSGLSGWEGRPEWSEGWSYDPAGFVHPGPLALLTASRALSDYHFEFLGLIERKGIGWVFRAADLRNYYAIKIVIARAGPLPRAVLVRYVVTDGLAVEQIRLPLPITIRIGRFYRIETSAYEDRFVTSIDGRVVDAFFDGQYRTGGVGLFSEPGEDARVMALRVADRDDFLGRLCAYFLGHSADTSNEAPRSISRTDPGGIERK